MEVSHTQLAEMSFDQISITQLLFFNFINGKGQNQAHLFRSNHNQLHADAKRKVQTTSGVSGHEKAPKRNMLWRPDIERVASKI